MWVLVRVSCVCCDLLLCMHCVGDYHVSLEQHSHVYCTLLLRLASGLVAAKTGARNASDNSYVIQIAHKT